MAQAGDRGGFQDRLLEKLSEAPADDGNLWAAYWGGSNEAPANIVGIAKSLTGSNGSRTVLIHGRYGMGKTSFARCLEKQIEPKAMSLWLPMSTLTANIPTTALSMVMAKIAQHLEDESRGCDPAARDFGQVVEDLWRIEAGALQNGCDDACDRAIPPEPNRMAGTARGDSRRHIRANSLEEEFDKCLQKIGKPLVVFLDDVDRCARRVAMDVIRLLLRFGSTRRVHFVITCDWDVLEQGVKDWMAAYGKADHGGSLVTANSALEKYIHFSVELPGMGQLARPDVVLPVADLAELKFLLTSDQTKTDDDDSKTNDSPHVSLADVFVVALFAEVMGDVHDQ